MQEMSEHKAKEAAKKRDNHECRFCGVTNEQHKEEYGKGLHAHHIIKEADGGADHPRNLITVCRTCHNTLEQTQANALSRIKEEHNGCSEERVEALEADLRKERNNESEIFGWFEEQSLRVHILIKGMFSLDIEFYQDREKAAEAYADHDGPCRLESRKVSFADEAIEQLRYVQTGGATLNINGTGGFFAGGEEPQKAYQSNDIPEELAREMQR